MLEEREDLKKPQNIFQAIWQAFRHPGFDEHGTSLGLEDWAHGD